MSLRDFPRFYQGDPFPPRMVRELTYSSMDSITGGSSGISGTTKVFGLNNLYDPDVSGTGHQPFGYDQLLAATGPYSRYKVLGCKVDIRAVPAASLSGWLVVAVHNASSSATISGLTGTEIAEKMNTRTFYISSAGNRERDFSFQFPSLAPLFGYTELEFKSESSNTTGPYNNSPGSK